jgi:LDH2 family malate/lactate/ureidoglycolate dehydrogenase
METQDLQQFYKEQLIRVGIDSQKAEQVTKVLTREELQLIRQILPSF